MRCGTPESVGIPSERIKSFVEDLERRRLSTHSFIMARGDTVFAECYYKPFDEHFLHRMYSVSKSFVSIAIGFCEQDGLLSLDDKMAKFFPEHVRELSENDVPTTTVREMLTMTTDTEVGADWFGSGTNDRTEIYFRPRLMKYPDTVFAYDSSGSYMLGAIVERLTGMSFLDYLREKVLDDIGFSKEAYCLMAPGGHSWGDSGIMCTSRDLLLFARFVLNGGEWNGKRYLNAEYIKSATTPSVANDYYGFTGHDTYGYGYQFWGAPNGCFTMIGMGTQLALMDPVHDLIFVITSDNQGNPHGYEMVYESFFNIVFPAIGNPLLENRVAYDELIEVLSSSKLFFVEGKKTSPFSEKIHNKRFIAEANPMGIKWFSLVFENDIGFFKYENAQGVKELRFGFGHNEFSDFPEDNYPDLVGMLPVPGNRYACASSADWQQERKLRVRVQIIDKYFGNLAIVFGFRDDNHVTVSMVKTAEAFLNEYNGLMNASCR